MKKCEFSKTIVVFSASFSVIVSAISVILMWRFGDLSALSYLIPAVFAEMATATGFYYWKARTENKIKLIQKYGEIAEKAIDTEKTNNGFDNYYGGM